MTDKKVVNRIPHEDIQTCESWDLPSVSGERSSLNRARQTNSVKETIEDVKPEDLKAVTAEQLQKVALEAENEGREKGYQEGLKQGFKDGESQGRNSGEKKAYDDTKMMLEQKAQYFQELANALLDPVSMQDQGLENTIMEIAIQFAQHLINRELTVDPSSLFETVESVVESLPAGAKNIQVYLHDDDIELAHEAFEATGKEWSFLADSTLNRGGCRVESEQSIIDYSVAERIRSMLEKVDFLGDVDPDSLPLVNDYRSVSQSSAKNEDDEGNETLDEGAECE